MKRLAKSAAVNASFTASQCCGCFALSMHVRPFVELCHSAQKGSGKGCRCIRLVAAIVAYCLQHLRSEQSTCITESLSAVLIQHWCLQSSAIGREDGGCCAVIWRICKACIHCDRTLSDSLQLLADAPARDPSQYSILLSTFLVKHFICAAMQVRREHTCRTRA